MSHVDRNLLSYIAASSVVVHVRCERNVCTCLCGLGLVLRGTAKAHLSHGELCRSVRAPLIQRLGPQASPVQSAASVQRWKEARSQAVRARCPVQAEAARVRLAKAGRGKLPAVIASGTRCPGRLPPPRRLPSSPTASPSGPWARGSRRCTPSAAGRYAREPRLAAAEALVSMAPLRSEGLSAPAARKSASPESYTSAPTSVRPSASSTCAASLVALAVRFPAKACPASPVVRLQIHDSYAMRAGLRSTGPPRHLSVRCYAAFPHSQGAVPAPCGIGQVSHGLRPLAPDPVAYSAAPIPTICDIPPQSGGGRSWRAARSSLPRCNGE